PEVEQRLIDTDNDGKVDDSVSIITIYSNQGDNGGAHTRDLIGQIIVYGDPVDRDDIIIEAGVTHGVVETIDEIGEALAPTGRLKVSTLDDGSEVIGYDSRDADGNPGAITGNPLAFVDNLYADSDLFSYASTLPEDLPPPVAVLSSDMHSELGASMRFDGEAGQYVEVPHSNAMALRRGTVALRFEVENINGTQTLLSKDARGWGDGGHITIELDSRGRVVVRLQGDDGEGFENIQLRSDAIEAGATYSLALVFSPEGSALYLNGELEDRDAGFSAGISANDESLVLGAGTSSRDSGQLNKLNNFFSGTISDVLLLDRDLTSGEVLFLAEEALPIQYPGGEAPDTDTPQSNIGVQTEIYGTDAGEDLAGGDGDDWILGGDGMDWLLGGAGADVFVFKPWHGYDTIEDFNPDEDFLALRDGLQIAGVRLVDADRDGQIDDTLVSFDPGDAVALLGVQLTEAELPLI
ncbi:MAG: Ca2+-binding RTX toxin-like protein, partial [Halieaceae bacterium]